ncbi:TRAP transporter solute receptor, unknown substrate 5 [plant metagenome]|uniref:TRAP-type C4-dicarboxylate transport system, periplasmic component n=1 Tax=plant metagenome TaxID=1297885 RepID=A0A484Q155_9ZZZZ
MRAIAKWAAAFTLALPAAMAGANTTWTMATGYPESSFFTQNIRQFISEVEKESGGRLKIDLRPNDTLIKHDAIKRAVQTGQIQAGEVRLGVYGNEDPMYVLDGLPNIAGNYEEAWQLMQAQLPYFEKILGRHNLRAITYVAWPGQGFYTKTPVASPADFKGKRLRIYSQPTLKMGQMLGFQATILPFAEVPQAFATGLIDSLFTSAQTGIDTQAWDNVKYFMYTGTLHNKNMVIVNDRAFKRLDDDLQKIVLAAGERASRRGFDMSRKAGDETIATLRANGMEVSEAPDSIQKQLGEVGETMMAEWRKTANPEQQKVLDDYLGMKKQAGN